MALLQRLGAARDFRPQGFLRFDLGTLQIGWIRRDRAEQLRRWTEVFVREGDRVHLNLALETELARTQALARVTRALADEGAIRGWRGETYAVRAAAGGETLFHLERAAMRFFGLTSAAAHLNGHAGEGPAPRILVARRAATKSIDPGMLDNLVAGGVPSGEDAWQTLLRECGEEAGIPRAVAERAQPAGVLQVCREIPEGLHSEILYCHDLALAPGFSPRNEDGEVSEFAALEAPALLDTVARGEMTVEAGLVAVDFLLRHGLAHDTDARIGAAIEACRC